jgi:folate-binding protein YgfZ
MKAWFDFIQTQSIQPIKQSNSLCALGDLGLLYVGGEDATDFLQNQLSNDIKLITEATSQLSSFSNAKGRMHGVMRIIQIEGGYLLLLPRSILASIQELLQKFVIMSRVILADISDSFARFSLNTDNSELIKDDIFPTEINQVYQSDSLISLRLQSGSNVNRYLLLSNNPEEAINLFSHLQSKLTVNDMTSWRLQEILAGVPTIYPETMGAFVLQMCNLQLLEGVNFKKGCYPGQEVVARMHYLGKLKRRMYLAELSSSICPSAGDELKSRSSDKADGSGKVVDAVKVTDEKCIMLFSAQIQKTEAGELVLLGQADKIITLRNLPYSFTD